MTLESHAASADSSGSGRALALRGRRLDCEDGQVEPVAEGGGERTGPRANVHQSHSLRGAQVTSYRLAPLRESVTWDLADRLVRCSGLLVIADPGYVMPPCWCPPRWLRQDGHDQHTRAARHQQ